MSVHKEIRKAFTNCFVITDFCLLRGIAIKKDFTEFRKELKRRSCDRILVIGRPTNYEVLTEQLSFLHFLQSLYKRGAHSPMMTTDLCPDEHFLPLEGKPVFSDPL